MLRYKTPLAEYATIRIENRLTFLANLLEMKWVPFGYADGREAFEQKERIILENLADLTGE